MISTRSLCAPATPLFSTKKAEGVGAQGESVQGRYNFSLTLTLSRWEREQNALRVFVVNQLHFIK